MTPRPNPRLRDPELVRLIAASSGEAVGPEPPDGQTRSLPGLGDPIEAEEFGWRLEALDEVEFHHLIEDVVCQLVESHHQH